MRKTSPIRTVAASFSNDSLSRYFVIHKKSLLVIALFVVAVSQVHASTTWYIATNGNDSSGCTQSAPCLSLNAAYLKAKVGDSVTIASGTYADQTVNADSTKTAGAGMVTFQPASGASVTLGKVNFNGSVDVTLQNVTISEWDVQMNSYYITLNNVTVNGGVFILGGSNLTMMGGSVGPGVNFHPQIAPVNGWNGQGQNITFDGVYFHDWTSTNLTLYHMECLQVVGTTNLTIRNSKFHHCDVFDLSFTTYNNGGQVTTPTLENNWFDTATNGGYFAINFQAMQGGLVRFNSSSQAWVMQSSVSGAVGTITGPVTFDGNIVDGGILDGDVYGCNPSNYASYNYNVTNGWKCGSTDANALTGFTNEAGFDFHLANGATALDFVPLSIPYPTTDIDGHSRPDGNSNDAGASQAVLVNPPTGLTAVVQ